jgi:phage gpG-like protein
MSFSVKMSGLDKLAAKLKKAKASSIKKVVIEAVTDELVSLVLQGFSSSSDPWGKPWDAPKRRDGKPLLDTGRLRNSITGLHGVVGSNVVYAATHNFGDKKRKIPKRTFIPPASKMPKAWRDAMNQAAGDAFLALLGED